MAAPQKAADVFQRIIGTVQQDMSREHEESERIRSTGDRTELLQPRMCVHFRGTMIRVDLARP